MTKEEYYQTVFEAIKEHFGDGYTVTRQTVAKNNGTELEGITVKHEGSVVAPTVYPDDPYRKGTDAQEAARAMIGSIEEAILEDLGALQFFYDYGEIKKKVCFRIVSAKRNEELLSRVPHRIIEDLAMIYVVPVDMGKRGQGTITVLNSHMDFWEADEDDLHLAAMENTPKLMPAKMMPMDEMVPLAKILGTSSLSIISNENFAYGAGVIFYTGLSQKLHKRLGDFYIIPASVHECILIPGACSISIDRTEEIIRIVNQECVEENEFLSDTLYRYDSDTGTIVPARSWGE